MAASKTQSDRIVKDDLVMLVEQVGNPGTHHKVGGVYRVRSVTSQGRSDYNMYYVLMEPISNPAVELGARVKRLKKI